MTGKRTEKGLGIDRGVVVLAAGGTGGHLFPAQALAEELVSRGYRIHLMTDERVADYGKSFPAEAIHIVPSATLSLRKPWLLPGRGLKLVKGISQAGKLLYQIKPVAVVGFGGYPSFPPIIAASRLKIPCAIHDQNAVMGRANRALSRFVDKVASSFPELQDLPARALPKLVVTGNPVRAIVIKEKAAPFPVLKEGSPFRVLVFGGSQGARVFAEFMPKVISALPEEVRRRLLLTQQCRAEDLQAVALSYERAGIKADLKPFFMDMPKQIAASHLVICRSGASTIAELGVIGRPAIMVPLPHAIDNDQLRNAESFASEGAGWIRPQADLEAATFAAFLTHLSLQSGELKTAAQKALTQGRPDAALRLAEVVETLAASAPGR